jgi:hypothetical protein
MPTGLRALAVLLLVAGMSQPADAEERLFRQIDDWLLNMTDEEPTFIRCYDALPDPRVRFQQITAADPYLPERVRERLNHIVREAIPRRWKLRDSLTVGGEIAEGRPGVDAAALLEELLSSPLSVRATVARSHLDVARLTLRVVVRTPDGKELCHSLTRQWHFDVTSLEVVDRPLFSARDVDIFDYVATLRDGLARTPPENLAPQGATAVVPFRVTTVFGGERCMLSEPFLLQDLRRAAADNAQSPGDYISNTARVYLPVAPEHADETPHLHMIVTRSVHADDEVADSVAVVEFVWREGRGERIRQSRIVALPPGALQDCTDGNAEDPVVTFLANAEEQRYAVTLAALSDPFALGDFMELDFVVEEPVYAYCWVLIEEGALVLYPHRESIAAEPLVAGTYRIPDDFHLSQMPLKDSGEALFHCFVGPSRPAGDLTERWLAAHRAQAILAWPAAEELSGDFRQVPTISEVWAWVRVAED